MYLKMKIKYAVYIKCAVLLCMLYLFIYLFIYLVAFPCSILTDSIYKLSGRRCENHLLSHNTAKGPNESSANVDTDLLCSAVSPRRAEHD